VERQIFYPRNLIPFMGLLRDLQSEIEQRGLTGAGKGDTLPLQSRVHVYKWIPTARQAVVDVLNKPAEMSTPLPVCCRKESGKGRKSPENSARKILIPMKSM
jgi:hypothetical protein